MKVSSKSSDTAEEDGSSLSTVFDSDDSDTEVPSTTNGIILTQKNCTINCNENSVDNSIIPQNPPIAHISSIALQNSSDITFGNKTLYNAPVTVNQFYSDNTFLKNIGDNSAFTPDANSKFAKKTKASVKQFYTSRWKIITVSISLILILLSVIIIFVWRDTYVNKSDIINIDNDHTELKIVTRKEWGARPINYTLDNLILPVSLVIIAHTVQQPCMQKDYCSLRVRSVQNLHIDMKYEDIGYNFLVGGDGSAYEGRGWDIIGAHTYRFNSKSIGIAFIGDFSVEAPPPKQLIAALKLIRLGVELKKITPNYTIVGHSQLIETESPGKKLFNIIQKWPHWSDENVNFFN